MYRVVCFLGESRCQGNCGITGHAQQHKSLFSTGFTTHDIRYLSQKIFWALEMLRIWYFWYGGPDIWHLDGVFNSLRISLAWQKNAKWQIKKDGPSISDCISVSTIYLLFHHPYSWCQRNCLFQKHCEKGPWTHITYSVHHRINLYEGSRVQIWC